jgi:hypothetical protein
MKDIHKGRGGEGGESGQNTCPRRKVTKSLKVLRKLALDNGHTNGYIVSIEIELKKEDHYERGESKDNGKTHQRGSG